MEFAEITSDVVEPILRLLDEYASPGPDELHPKILEILVPFIAKPLAHLFILSLTTGHGCYGRRFPTVYPIFKKVQQGNSGKLPTCKPQFHGLRNT